MSMGRFFTPCAIALVGLAALKGLAIVDQATGLGALEAPAYAAGGGKKPDDHGAKDAHAKAPKGHGDDAHADAAASEEAGAEGAHAADEHPAPDHASSDHQAAAQPSAAASCGPAGIAERAGLSVSEIEVLRSLSERRRTLDAREHDIATQATLLTAAEDRVADQLLAMKAVRDDIANLLGQMDEAEAIEIDRLVGMYEKMKAKDAAAILPRLDEEVLVKVAARMKPPALAGVLAAMNEDQAAALTMLLATRHEEARTLAAAFAQMDGATAPTQAEPDAASDVLAEGAP